MTVLLLLFFTVAQTWAQQCDQRTRPLSSPNDGFYINGDGTVTHIDSGLTWMRCPVGQHWDGKTCTGQARQLTWAEAMREADQYRRRNHHGQWRVPRLPELALIIERQCLEPKINLSIFPNTPSAPFWTATQRGKSEQFYTVDFEQHGMQAQAQQQRFYLRLVSGR